MNNTLDCVAPTDSILNQPSKEVSSSEIKTRSIQDLINRMLELARGKGNGTDTRQMVGLAAVQLGVALRVIIVDIAADGSSKEQRLVPIINPVIEHTSEEMVDGREGCWSCADICGNVSRHESVRLTGFDREGAPLSVELSGFVARIAQHEVDHLDGVRFPDRIPVDEPERLHAVSPTEFERYREEWSNWPNLCDRQVWVDMKSGIVKPYL